MDRKHQILQQYFGYSSFRSGQEALIDALLAGRDVMGVMPTGGGKSLCFQIPALLSDHITLVVSPLISLMKDQVATLKKVGVPAAYINSSLSPGQIRAVYRNLINGQYKIVYIAPERLLMNDFLQTVTKIRISMLAVDEAHCISQWGYDFRPSYLKIAEFVYFLGYRPVISAFTATATAQVCDDIEHILEMHDPLRIVTGFGRPNLHFEVLKSESRRIELLHLIQDRPGQSGIVYCATRSEVEINCIMLRNNGILAVRYHAGLSEKERCANQDDFLNDRCCVMVATNAFGMGIDKSNISYVIHYNMPQSIEMYYQEAGRAGRDGSDAACILLYSEKDNYLARSFVEHPRQRNRPLNKEKVQMIKRDLERLQKMIEYCNTTDCLHGYILDYFGEEHEKNCNHCGNCDAAKNVKEKRKQILSICLKKFCDFIKKVFHFIKSK